MLWLPSWAMTLPLGRRLVSFSLLVLLVWPFAFTNNLRMASIVTADIAMVRADRQTGATDSTKTNLDRARDAQDRACGPGQGKSKACQLRQNELTEAKNASKMRGAMSLPLPSPTPPTSPSSLRGRASAALNRRQTTSTCSCSCCAPFCRRLAGCC
jgi:hypothetical protein